MSKNEIELLQRKVLDRCDLNQLRVADVIQQIETEDKFLNDALVFTNQFKFNNSKEDGLILGFGKDEFQIAKFPTRQIANHFGIPTPYVNKLADGERWQRQLIADILNRHATKTSPKRLLVRAVDDHVRGVLSDSYKRINSKMIFHSFLTAALKQDAKLYNASSDETKSFVEVVLPKIVQIDTEKNGVISMILGASLRSSDYGDGTLMLRTFLMNVACMNGQLGKKFLNEVHRGGRLPDNLVLSDDTYKKESIAQAAVVRDSMDHLFNEQNMKEEIERIQRAADTPMNVEQGITKLKRTKHYSEDELSSLVKKLSAGRPEDGIVGEDTVWKFVSGITAVANEYQTTRRNELIEYASELLN